MSAEANGRRTSDKRTPPAEGQCLGTVFGLAEDHLKRHCETDGLDTALEVLDSERQRYLDHGAKSASDAENLWTRLTPTEVEQVYFACFGDTEHVASRTAIRNENDPIRRHQRISEQIGAAWQANTVDKPRFVAVSLAVWAMTGRRRLVKVNRSHIVPNLTKATETNQLQGTWLPVPTAEIGSVNSNPLLPDIGDLCDFTYRGRTLPLPEAARGAAWVHAAAHELESYEAKARGGVTKTGKGAPLSLRILVASAMQLGNAAPDNLLNRYVVPTSQLLSWIYPDGHRHLARDWQRLTSALMAASNLWVGNGATDPRYRYAVRLFTAWQVPESLEAWKHDGVVEFMFRLPKDQSCQGGRVDFDQLARYGVTNRLAYRGYLSAVAVMDKTARNGKPAKRGDFHVPALDPVDLAAMCGLDANKRREYRYRGVKTFETMAEDGIIDLEHDTRADVWRLWGPQNPI